MDGTPASAAKHPQAPVSVCQTSWLRTHGSTTPSLGRGRPQTPAPDSKAQSACHVRVYSDVLEFTQECTSSLRHAPVHSGVHELTQECMVIRTCSSPLRHACFTQVCVGSLRHAQAHSGGSALLCRMPGYNGCWSSWRHLHNCPTRTLLPRYACIVQLSGITGCCVSCFYVPCLQCAVD